MWKMGTNLWIRYNKDKENKEKKPDGTYGKEMKQKINLYSSSNISTAANKELRKTYRNNEFGNKNHGNKNKDTITLTTNTTKRIR